MKASILIVCVALLWIITGCSTPPPKEQPTPRKYFEPAPDTSQLPERTLQKASTRYHGSFGSESVAPDLGGENKSGTPESAKDIKSAPIPPNRLSAVLGPINAEGIEVQGSKGNDAGQMIREAIAQELTLEKKLVLIDAPQERFKNDSPRPDLASRGIRYVIKGVATYNKQSGYTTVFLRAVRTSNGKVKAVASARNKNKQQAAAQAARILLERLEGM